MNFEDEIEVLESTLSHLEGAIQEITDSPYHSYLAQTWEMDLEEIKARLDELYELQNEEWKKEVRDLEFDYERSVI